MPLPAAPIHAKGISGVLFHVERQVRDPQSRAGLLGRACFTWNTRYEIPRVERASSGAPVSRGTPGTRSPESSGPPRACLFHGEHQVRDPQSRAGLLGRACFTWNTRYEIPRVERASSGAPVSRGTPGTRSPESSGPSQTTAPDQKSGRFAGTPTRRGYRSDVGPTLRRSW